MPHSSASIRLSPPLGAGPLHVSKVDRGPGLAKAEPPISASDAEQDDRPTQRRIPVGAHDPRPENTGTIVVVEGELHLYGPGAKWLGRYPNTFVAQRRLDLFFGRRAAAKGIRPPGDIASSEGADQRALVPSAAGQGRKPDGGRG